MQNYLPVVQVPIDLEAFSEMLTGERSQIEYAFNSQVERSVVLDPYGFGRFKWPNIYDVIYLLIYECLEKGMSVKEATTIAESEVNDLAEQQEILRQIPVSSRSFLSDPSGLASILSTTGGNILDTCFSKYRGTDRRLQEANLIASIQFCIKKFNWYLLEDIVSIPRHNVKLEKDGMRNNARVVGRYIQ